MPLAEGTGAVPGFFEGLRDGDFVHVEAFLTGGNAANTGAGIVSAGEEFGPGGRANTADKKAVEQRAVSGQRVNIRGRKILVPVDAEVAPPLVVRKEDDDIGPRRRDGRQRRELRQEKKEGEEGEAARGAWHRHSVVRADSHKFSLLNPAGVYFKKESARRLG